MTDQQQTSAQQARAELAADRLAAQRDAVVEELRRRVRLLASAARNLEALAARAAAVAAEDAHEVAKFAVNDLENVMRNFNLCSLSVELSDLRALSGK